MADEDTLEDGEGNEPDDIPDPIPEADSPEVEKQWEESDPMEGPSPTG